MDLKKPDVLPQEDFHIKFIPEVRPEGHATATLAVAWQYDDATVQYLGAHNDRDTKLLLVVVGNETVHGWSGDYTRFRVMSARLVDVFSRTGKPLPQKAFVSFHRAGENYVLGKIVRASNVPQQREVTEWLEEVRGTTNVLNLDDAGAPYFDNNFLPRVFRYGFTEARLKVVVPSEMFAKEPSPLAKSLVRRFFRGKENDQCHFRKRLAASIGISIPVQLYGIFARIAILLFALLVGMRNIFTKDFFAFNPHDYGKSLHGPRYVDYRVSGWRSLVYFLLTPFGLSIAALSLVAFWGIGFIGLSVLVGSAALSDYSFWQITGYAILIALGIALLVGLFVLVVTRNGRGLIREVVAEPIGSWATTIVVRYRPEPAVVTSGGSTVVDTQEAKRVAHELYEAQANVTSPSQVPNGTVRLMFDALKRRVCLPFQR